MQGFSAVVWVKKKKREKTTTNTKIQKQTQRGTFKEEFTQHPVSPLPRPERTLPHASRYLFLQLADYESTLFLGYGLTFLTLFLARTLAHKRALAHR